MCKYNHYVIDGIEIDIPLKYFEHAKMYLEEYPDFKKDPVFTEHGYMLTLSIEDACENAEVGINSVLVDCSSCKYFVRDCQKTLFGICKRKTV